MGHICTCREEEFSSFPHGPRIFRALQGLRSMNVSLCHVLFLSLLRNYERLGSDPVTLRTRRSGA